MSKMKRAIEKFQIDIKMKRLDLHFKRELENVREKSPVEVKSLDSSQLKQINDFYNGFGFHGVDTRWHEYLYAVTGRHSVNYIPENFYHCTIEPLYTRGSVDLEDKSIMSRMLPGIRMVSNVLINTNGVFFDEHDDVLSTDEAVRYLNNLGCNLIIKPSRETGGGMGVRLVNAGGFNTAILDVYKKDYIIQKCIAQHPQYKEFNPSSVNTEKIISMFFNGEVHILTSILRVGAPGSHTDTASTGKGYTVGIGLNGQLNKEGYNIYGERRTSTSSGRMFENVVLCGHDEICSQIKKAHKMLSRFGIISWDFAVDENCEPILIEYNLNYPDVMIYQMNNGPLFGDLTQTVLEDVREKLKKER